MSEFVILSKKEVEKMFKDFLEEIKGTIAAQEGVVNNEKMNQKEAAKFLGITEATLIRWKKKELVPYEQLPGSAKITYYKSQLKATIQRNPKLLQAPRN